MFKVYNMQAIVKLSSKSFRANRARNLIAILAIALTTVLFTSIFAMGIGTVDSVQRAIKRQAGGDGHIDKFLSKFSDTDFVIAHAKNGKIGVEQFMQSAPGTFDAILMDIRMPIVDVLQAASVIRALARPDAKEIPIIAMTANAYADDVEKSGQVGMNAHHAKPIEPQRLYETLQDLMRAPNRRS